MASGTTAPQPTPAPPAGSGQAPAPTSPGESGSGRIGRAVLAASGEPCRGAFVHLETDPFDMEWHREKPMFGISVDEAGRFAVPVDSATYRMIAIVPGWGCSDWWPAGPGDSEVILRVSEGNFVEGTVLDAQTGRPLGGLWVQLAVFGEFGRGSGPSCEADREGRYRFGPIPPGMAVLPESWGAHGYQPAEPGLQEVQSAGDAAFADLLARGRAVRFDGAGKKAVVDIRMARGAGVLVTYRLQFPPGMSPPAQVEVLHMRRWPPPGEPEKAPAPGAEGGASPWASSGGESQDLDPVAREVTVFLPVAWNRVWVRAGRAWAAAPDRIVREAGPAESQVLALGPIAPVFVQLVDAEGRPLSRAGVIVEMSLRSAHAGGMGAWPSGEATTDSSGRAEVTDVLPRLDLGRTGGAEVWGTDPAGRTDVAEVRLKGEGLYDAPRNGTPPFAIREPELRARVTAAGEQPVVLHVRATPWIPVVIEFVDGDGRPIGGLSVRGEPATCFDGEAAARAGPDGRVRLRYRGAVQGTEGAREARAVIVDEGWLGLLPLGGLAVGAGDAPASLEGAPALLRLRASRARKLTLRILDRAGAPLAGADVETHFFAAAGSVVQRWRPDETGRVVLKFLLSGKPETVMFRRFAPDGGVLPGGFVQTSVPPGADEMDVVLHTVIQHVDVPVGPDTAYGAGTGDMPRTVALDGDGREIARGTGSWSGIPGKPGWWRLTFGVPPTTRRLVVSLRGETLTLDLPEGDPVPPPEWRIR
ncbi:MAG: hypothetical protein L0216_05580 [Planctomycetales bacterium]|nr:hypothetical protein [Planctomycetales bacterium]